MAINVAEVDLVSEEEVSSSALSWSAIIAGALAAAGVTLILMALGAGLGFASISPWSRLSTAATTFGVMAAIWFVVVQWLASAFGGYLAGRLRAKWVAIHSDESTFRDTAHGVLAWALATAVVALPLSGSIAALVAGTAATAAAVGTPAPTVGAASAPEPGIAAGLPGFGYFTDSLFRSDHPVGIASEIRAEAGRILARDLGPQGFPNADKAYLAHFLAATTGIDQATATKRVADVIGQLQAEETDLKKKADTARKAASAAAFASAFSLLIGAFIAGAAGALGGRHRDDQPLPTAS
jgi:hypothetical protein